MFLMEFATRLLVALLLGALIGAERQWRQRLAGLRTNSLVALGAALYVLLSVMTEVDSSPTRIAAAVVSGMGFLGAGVIMRDGFNIRGLNTAATLWCAAAVGVLSGSGYMAEAAVGTLVILCANILLRLLQRIINKVNLTENDDEQCYNLHLVCEEDQESHIRAVLFSSLDGSALTITALSSEDAKDKGKIIVSADLMVANGGLKMVEEVVGKLSLENTVSSIRWNVFSD